MQEKGKRIYNHLLSKGRYNSRLFDTLNAIAKSGLSVIREKWLESPDEDLCYWFEIYIIDYLGLDTLCNLNPGGRGGVSYIQKPNSGSFKKGSDTGRLGKHQTEESKARISASKRGKRTTMSPEAYAAAYAEAWKNSSARMKENNPAKRPEVKLKMSASTKGRRSPSKGIKRPEVSGENHWLFGKHPTAESKLKNKLSHQGKKSSKETCLKQSESMKESWIRRKAAASNGA